MIFGIPTPTFTLIHVLISLIGIASGTIMLGGLLGGSRLKAWIDIFLVTTILTSVTGFMFPFERVTPAQIFGVVSLMVLAAAVAARGAFLNSGARRRTFIVSATSALYLNVFVLVVQLFQKIPLLKVLAPTQTEAPFLVTQLAVLCAFIALGVMATGKFAGTRMAHAQAGDR